MTILPGPLVVILFAAGNVLVQGTCLQGYPDSWAAPDATWYLNSLNYRHYASVRHWNQLLSDSTISGRNDNQNCIEEYIVSETEMYYLTADASTGDKRCSGYNVHGSVIRQYYEAFSLSSEEHKTYNSGVSCQAHFAGTTDSFILIHDSFTKSKCPFMEGLYNFTYSDGTNIDVCEGDISSTASVESYLINLKSCFRPIGSPIEPYYNPFYCLADWKASSRDDPAKGDFLVLYMLDGNGQKKPFCARYKILNGRVIMSINLAVAVNVDNAVMCDSTKSYDYSYTGIDSKWVSFEMTPLFEISKVSKSTPAIALKTNVNRATTQTITKIATTTSPSKTKPSTAGTDTRVGETRTSSKTSMLQKSVHVTTSMESRITKAIIKTSPTRSSKLPTTNRVTTVNNPTTRTVLSRTDPPARNNYAWTGKSKLGALYIVSLFLATSTMLYVTSR